MRTITERLESVFRGVSGPGVAIAVLLIFMSGPVLADGAGIVTGIVRNRHSGEPLPYASVVLVGTGRGSPAGREGRVIIRNGPPGG